MAFPRYTLRSLLLKVAGAFVLLFIAGTGFLWVLFEHPYWIYSLVAHNTLFRIRDWAYKVRLSLPSSDADQDGVPDWIERGLGTDPDNSASHPTHYPVTIGHSRKVYAGERTRLTWRQRVEGVEMRWPAGFRATVFATTPMLLTPGSDGPPTKGPLQVTASRDGLIAFDVLVSDPDALNQVWLADPVTKENVSGIGEPGSTILCYGWRLPSVPSTIEWRIPDSETESAEASPYPGMMPPTAKPHIVWKHQSPPPIEVYIIEAARADQPDEWFPAWEIFFPADSQNHLTRPVEPLDPDLFPNYTGPLSYRVVPVSKTPPGKTPE